MPTATLARQLPGTGVEWPRTLALVATRRTGMEGWRSAGDGFLMSKTQRMLVEWDTWAVFDKF
jgi:hypothetical protein